MRVLNILIAFFMVFAVCPKATNVNAEFNGNCPKKGMILEIIPPDYRIDGKTVTFNKETIFCVKAADKNSGKIIGTSFTVNWLNHGDQVPDISHVNIYEEPTAVMLSYFDANFYKKYVTLIWETAGETDIIGFNVYRSKGIDGAKKRVNKELIQANYAGTPMGDIYKLTDFNNRKYNKHFYWLEVICLDGSLELYEAYKVKN